MVKYCPPGIPKDCPLLPTLRDHIDGLCDRCGKELVSRQKRWCSDKCASWASREFSKNHDWSDARRAARRRDKYRCVRPGCESKERLQVNHIIPLVGSNRNRTCLNHLENLELLCAQHHQIETNRQRAERKAAKEAK